MNLDLYHAQIGEGNLIQLIRDSIDLVGLEAWASTDTHTALERFRQVFTEQG